MRSSQLVHIQSAQHPTLQTVVRVPQDQLFREPLMSTDAISTIPSTTWRMTVPVNPFMDLGTSSIQLTQFRVK